MNLGKKSAHFLFPLPVFNIRRRWIQTTVAVLFLAKAKRKREKTKVGGENSDLTTSAKKKSSMPRHGLSIDLFVLIDAAVMTFVNFFVRETERGKLEIFLFPLSCDAFVIAAAAVPVWKRGEEEESLCLSPSGAEEKNCHHSPTSHHFPR